MRTVIELYANAMKNRSYKLIKMCVRSGDEVTNKLNKMTIDTAVQMKDRPFSGKDPLLIVNLWLNLKTTCDTCIFQEFAAIWLFEN